MNWHSSKRDNGGGGAVCACREGFIGDGLACEAIPTFDGDYLVLSHGMALMKVGRWFELEELYILCRVPRRTKRLFLGGEN